MQRRRPLTVRPGYGTGTIVQFGSYLGVLTARHELEPGKYKDDSCTRDLMAEKCSSINTEFGGVGIQGSDGSFTKPGPLMLHPDPHSGGFLFRGERKREGGDWVFVGLAFRNGEPVTSERLKMEYGSGCEPYRLPSSVLDCARRRVGELVYVHHFGGLRKTASVLSKTPTGTPFAAKMEVLANQEILDADVQQWFAQSSLGALHTYPEVGLFAAARDNALDGVAGVNAKELVGGASGSAYWNVEGELVGIHRAAGDVGDDKSAVNLATDVQSIVAGIAQEVVRAADVHSGRVPALDELMAAAEGSRVEVVQGPASGQMGTIEKNGAKPALEWDDEGAVIKVRVRLDGATGFRTYGGEDLRKLRLVSPVPAMLPPLPAAATPRAPVRGGPVAPGAGTVLFAASPQLCGLDVHSSVAVLDGKYKGSEGVVVGNARTGEPAIAFTPWTVRVRLTDGRLVRYEGADDMKKLALREDDAAGGLMDEG